MIMEMFDVSVCLYQLQIQKQAYCTTRQSETFISFILYITFDRWYLHYICSFPAQIYYTIKPSTRRLAWRYQGCYSCFQCFCTEQVEISTISENFNLEKNRKPPTISVRLDFLECIHISIFIKTNLRIYGLKEKENFNILMEIVGGFRFRVWKLWQPHNDINK